MTNTYTERFTTPIGNFLSSPSLERDTFCDQPDLQDLHASFMRPVSYSRTDQLFPVFSNSKLEGFNDILIPAWYYWFVPFRHGPLSRCADGRQQARPPRVLGGRGH